MEIILYGLVSFAIGFATSRWLNRPKVWRHVEGEILVKRDEDGLLASFFFRDGRWERLDVETRVEIEEPEAKS